MYIHLREWNAYLCLVQRIINSACYDLFCSKTVCNVINPEIKLEEIGKLRKSLPKVKLTKAIHVEDESAVELAKKFEKYVDYLLLDTKAKGKLGGTGVVHNWDISRKIVKSVKCKVFLAGGLNPTNVHLAVEKVQPFAVDTNSGVKAKDRKKDETKLAKFIERAKK